MGKSTHRHEKVSLIHGIECMLQIKNGVASQLWIAFSLSARTLSNKGP